MAKTFQDKLDELGMNAYNLMEKKWELKNIFNYLLDWRDRKATNLPGWLKQQVEIDNELNTLAHSLIKDRMENTAVNIQRWIVDNINYTPDKVTWQTDEKWQTAKETYSLKKGDCEDGAILFLVLCRKAGIPANRVRIVAGDVKGGGHCWSEFLIAPFSYVMDWCYWPDTSDMNRRKAYILGKAGGGNYYKIWFMCNDEKAFGAFLK